MAQLIEDYALIGNNATVALVSRTGSMDWLCFPRFDSAACLAALLGTRRNGHWTITPSTEERPSVERRYQPGTLILETEWSTSEGAVVVIDFMDRRGECQDVVRLVRGLRGSVNMQMEMILRFDYGQVVPWVSRNDDGSITAIAGPNRLVLTTPAQVFGEDLTTRAQFVVREGEEVPFILTWSHSHSEPSSTPDAAASLARIQQSWEDWSAQYNGKGEYREAVLRSLITLKALTHHATGGMVAAATTSLPEEINGIRNWDYRYCWLRDATFTLYALLESGFKDEASNWREWLVRAIAGDPDEMQIMYSVSGERRLTEFEVPALQGYQGSKPVRIGNAASEQVQLDVYGEVLDALYQARRKGLPGSDAAWSVQKALVNHLEQIWELPDDGIWEIRGERRHFVHSKVMAWVAFDRAIRTVEEFDEDGPLERWRKVRSDIFDQVCLLGFSRELNSFVQYFGSKDLDASLLMLPLVGFLPVSDPRIAGTIAAVEKNLLHDGFVVRYNPSSNVDGLPGGEGVFLACSFWLIDNYMLQGRDEEAEALFEKLLAIRNDVGLLAEEYDPREQRHLGNFPQAFSHLSLVNTAHNLAASHGGVRPAEDRGLSAR